VNYCSVQDVRIALAADGLNDGTNTAADMSDNTLTDAITEASAVVDSYVGGPYSDTDTVPSMVVYWTRDIAAFLATLTWRKSKDLTVMDPVYLRYQLTLDRLMGIATGTTAMPSDQLPTSDPYAGTVINPMGDWTLFNWWDFDLWGRDASTQGDDVWYRTVTWWPGYPY